MPDSRRRTCKLCGKSDAEVGAISWRGYCGTCGPDVAEAAALQLHHHSGPFFRRWRNGIAACVGAIPLDEVERLLDEAARGAQTGDR